VDGWLSSFSQESVALYVKTANFVTVPLLGNILKFANTHGLDFDNFHFGTEYQKVILHENYMVEVT